MSEASGIPLFGKLDSYLRTMNLVQGQCLVGSLTGEVIC